MYIYVLFHIIFYYDLLQDIEFGSLCYTTRPCFLSILYIIAHIFQSQTPNLTLPAALLSLGNQKSVLYVWACFCLIDKFIFVSF